jgi:hypothetical protein
MLLAVVAHVFGARSVFFLLLRIDTAEIIWILDSPFLIGLPLLLAATVGPTTGLLPLVEPWIGIKPATTERTSPPRGHAIVPPANILKRSRSRRAEKKKSGKKKGKAIENEFKK